MAAPYSGVCGRPMMMSCAAGRAARQKSSTSSIPLYGSTAPNMITTRSSPRPSLARAAARSSGRPSGTERSPCGITRTLSGATPMPATISALAGSVCAMTRCACRRLAAVLRRANGSSGRLCACRLCAVTTSARPRRASARSSGYRAKRNQSSRLALARVIGFRPVQMQHVDRLLPRPIVHQPRERHAALVIAQKGDANTVLLERLGEQPLVRHAIAPVWSEEDVHAWQRRASALVSGVERGSL